MKWKLVMSLLLLVSGCGGGGGSNFGCGSLDCKTAKYNLLLADVDFSATSPEATNITVLATSSYQDMTHPRVSHDKAWVAFTTYNDTNADGCASTDSGYANTEIKAVSLDGTQEKSVIPVSTNELNSNSYWFGSNYEFTFLSGPPGATKIYRAQTDGAMKLVAGPTLVDVPATIIPFDPQAISGAQLVYGGTYDSGGGNFAKSIFMESMDDIMDVPVGLSLGRDSTGAPLYGSDVMENDPKLSPDGAQVAFMRRAPNAGANGFGWRIFMVDTASPHSLDEVNISPASFGSSLLVNDVLPEWVDNSTLVFSFIDVSGSTHTRTLWTMQSDGTGRKQIQLPAGYRYSDVFPFLDGSGNQKMVISAEKVSASCS